MTIQEAMIPARAYVDQQMDVMRKHGSAPELTPEKYEELVLKIAKITVKARGK